MTGTTNLGLPYITVGQSQKEVTHGDDLDRIDARFDDAELVDLSAGNGSVVLADLQQCSMILAAGASMARNLTLDPFKGARLVANGGSHSISVIIGSTTTTLLAGGWAVAIGDGTTNGLSLLQSGAFGGLTPTQVTALLTVMVGDSGSGGTKGLVGAPGAGDAAAGKFWSAGGVWDTPAGTGAGDTSGPASAVDGHMAVFDGTTGKLLKDGGSPSAGGGLPYGNIDAPPASAGFSWVNQGSAAIAQAGGMGTPMMLTLPSSGSDNWRGRFIAQPSTPYALYAYLCFDAVTLPTSGAQIFGAYFYDGTKLMGLEFISVNSGGIACQLRVQKITSVTSGASTPAARPSGFAANEIPLVGFANYLPIRLTNDGSDLSFSYSLDGYNWIVLFSEPIGTHLTPTHIGFGGLNTNAVDGADLHISLLSWKTA